MCMGGNILRYYSIRGLKHEVGEFALVELELAWNVDKH
jgi:hypothetical protein